MNQFKDFYANRAIESALKATAALSRNDHVKAAMWKREALRYEEAANRAY